MSLISAPRKPATSLLASIALVLAAPASPGETEQKDCIGAITASGQVTVNGLAASAGTTLFSGDTVEASGEPALLQLTDGTRMELVKAKATFNREGQRLILVARTGLFRFNIPERVDTLILTRQYRVQVSDKGSPTIGGLATNQNGQLAISACKGKLVAADDARTEQHGIANGQPLLILRQRGVGSLQKGEDTLTDATMSWKPDELKGRFIHLGDQTKEILGNGEHSLTMDGAWEKPTGPHGYEIGEPPAAPPSSRTPITEIAIAGLASCMTPLRAYSIVPAAAGAAAGTATGLQINTKSQSSRF